MITRGDKINDRYQIIKNIGEGGMANVYLALDTILNRQVAVKVLRGDLADDEKFVRRFQREALSASKLSHPNIVEMYDVGEDNGLYYIVMEYIDGKTLKSLIKKRGALTLPEVIDIMLQLTSAIMCAHDSYIIHRDIKPQNVLILDNGKVKITDFGIAVALNSNELTQTNSIMGSVHYLPPEQASGSGSTIKSDIYSLGILMYELLTGKLPFKGDNAVEIAIKQMKEPIPSICAEFPDIPQSVENIVIKACAKNPKNRYDSVKEMYEDIKTCMDRPDEKKYVYPYKEHEVDETKPLPNLEKFEKKGDNMKKNKKGVRDKILIILGSLLAFLVATICLFIIIYPKLVEVPNVYVPDVSGLSLVEAEELLKSYGLVVNADYEEVECDDAIEVGKVCSTSPWIGKSVKEGTNITLKVAKKTDEIVVSNYTGENYQSVLANLTNAGINVIVEQTKIEKNNQSKYKENTIVNQSAQAGTKLAKGDTIVLYYAVYTVEYPDFFSENYTIDAVEDFCKKYNITLIKQEVETEDYTEGVIFYQSRTGEVVNGTTLTIKIAKAILSEETDAGQDSEDNQ